MEKQKELHRLTKELIKQITGKEVEDTQDADYQIYYYYLSKAMDYTRCCESDSEQLRDEYLQPELDKYRNIKVERTTGKSDSEQLKIPKTTKKQRVQLDEGYNKK
jgi:hypothetical protein